MTLKDLVTAGLVDDDTKITISRVIVGNMIDLRKGTWFQDDVVNFLNCEISAMTFDEQNGFSISCK